MKQNTIIIIIIIVLLLATSTYLITSTNSPTKTKAVDRSVSKMEVFQLGKNVYRYLEAASICDKVGATLATKEDINRALHKGAQWNNIGWVRNLQAYFPLPKTNKYGKKGLNGGKMSSQLKLGATCVGIKPSKKNPITKEFSILPWSKTKWSQFD
jgi:hypothetical protein